jgi:hypothetical protein
MGKSEHKNLIMKDQSSVSHPKPHKSTTESKDNELTEMSDREKPTIKKLPMASKKIQINRSMKL